MAHHVHSFFPDEANERLLSKQGWMIEEDGRSRVATVKDIKDFERGREGDLNEDTWARHRKWKLPVPEGIGRSYRFSNPLEMVAETTADYYRELLKMVKGNNSTGPSHQTPVINFILDKISRFK